MMEGGPHGAGASPDAGAEASVCVGPRASVDSPLEDRASGVRRSAPDRVSNLLVVAWNEGNAGAAPHLKTFPVKSSNAGTGTHNCEPGTRTVSRGEPPYGVPIAHIVIHFLQSDHEHRRTRQENCPLPIERSATLWTGTNMNHNQNNAGPRGRLRQPTCIPRTHILGFGWNSPANPLAKRHQCTTSP